MTDMHAESDSLTNSREWLMPMRFMATDAVSTPEKSDPNFRTFGRRGCLGCATVFPMVATRERGSGGGGWQANRKIGCVYLLALAEAAADEYFVFSSMAERKKVKPASWLYNLPTIGCHAEASKLALQLANMRPKKKPASWLFYNLPTPQMEKPAR